MKKSKRNNIGCLIAVVIIMVACQVLASCKAHQSLVSERVVYDTVWSVKVVHDSIRGAVVEREITRIVPHIIRVGDTTIVYSDTIVNRNSEKNNYIYRNIYSDAGKISMDTARVTEKYAPKQEQKNEKASKNKKIFWIGVIIGMLITLAIVHRKAVISFIGRLAKRHLRLFK